MFYNVTHRKLLNRLSFFIENSLGFLSSSGDVTYYKPMNIFPRIMSSLRFIIRQPLCIRCRVYFSS